MTLFVSFEGGEGSGKTTQVGILLRRLEERGHPTVQLREPGMTPLGNAAREWLKRSRPKEKPLTEGAELCCSRRPGRRWSPRCSSPLWKKRRGL